MFDLWNMFLLIIAGYYYFNVLWISLSVFYLVYIFNDIHVWHHFFIFIFFCRALVTILYFTYSNPLEENFFLWY